MLATPEELQATPLQKTEHERLTWVYRKIAASLFDPSQISLFSFSRLFAGIPLLFLFAFSAFRGPSGRLPFFRARRRHETDILAGSKMARDDFGIRRRDHFYEFHNTLGPFREDPFCLRTVRVIDVIL